MLSPSTLNALLDPPADPPDQPPEDILRDLLDLAHHLGAQPDLAMLGEGNVSARLDDATFRVKASGTQLGTLSEQHLVTVASAPLLDAMDEHETMSDEAMRAMLLASRRDAGALKPSVESLFHAWLLQLPGIAFVGHCHPCAVNQILCSPRAEDFAQKRLFPDQIVYCGGASVLVPYVDPGLVLAREIARRVLAFAERYRQLPKTILLENHGLIALGATAQEVMAATDMMEKSARVFIGAAALGGPVFLPDDQVARITGRPDEHYRQRMLRL